MRQYAITEVVTLILLLINIKDANINTLCSSLGTTDNSEFTPALLSMEIFVPVDVSTWSISKTETKPKAIPKKVKKLFCEILYVLRTIINAEKATIAVKSSDMV
jgi:hypothetical protein